MCGIVAYTGDGNCRQILIEGLKRLEYRGYDSAGIAILSPKNEGYSVQLLKEAGKIRELEAELGNRKMEGGCGIGHTRWATHGEPNKNNAHPHQDCKGEVTLVHNGIIENYITLKKDLEANGHRFLSDTDTEVLPHLLEHSQGSLLKAMQSLSKKIKGSGAIVAISPNEPGVLIGTRISSPLIAGISEKGNFLASDIPAVLEHTRKFLLIEDYETVRVTPKKVEIFDRQGRPVRREPFNVDWSISSAQKDGFDDFMLKEIFEQPKAVRDTMRGRQAFEELNMDEQQIKGIKKINIIACGTSYHAALTGKQLIEKWARVPVEIDYSSEYRYRDPVVEAGSLFVAITQSGETIDTLAAIREARSKGARVVAITNIVGSSAARESDSVIYTHAGPEIGVCATKTFTAQLMLMYLMALYFARAKGTINYEKFKQVSNGLEAIPDKIQHILDRSQEIKRIAGLTSRYTCFLFLGRIYGLPMAMEGALKLKEVSYIHAEGYPAGEMKHGPIALADKNTLVVGIMPHDGVYEKMLSNILEVKARGADLFAISDQRNGELEKQVDHYFAIPEVIEELSGILTAIPLQLYSYYIAKNLGRDVDQPRNLAKSVTVE